jgi:hypothetical protein
VKKAEGNYKERTARAEKIDAGETASGHMNFIKVGMSDTHTTLRAAAPFWW